MNGKPMTREEAAWHEAGHVVAAWALGGELVSSTARRWLAPDRAKAGHTHNRMRHAIFSDDADAAVGVSLIHAAGPVSQSAATGEDIAVVCSRYASGDIRKAADLLGVPVRSDASRGMHTVIRLEETGTLGRCLDEILSNAEELLAPHAALTESVARYLMRHWRLKPKGFARLRASLTQ